jgi:hypothetical protein
VGNTALRERRCRTAAMAELQKFHDLRPSTAGMLSHKVDPGPPPGQWGGRRCPARLERGAHLIHLHKRGIRKQLLVSPNARAMWQHVENPSAESAQACLFFGRRRQSAWFQGLGQSLMCPPLCHPGSDGCDWRATRAGWQIAAALGFDGSTGLRGCLAVWKLPPLRAATRLSLSHAWCCLSPTQLTSLVVDDIVDTPDRLPIRRKINSAR